FELWDPAAGALVNSPMGKLSDQLVMLAGNNEVILNQQQKPVTDLISNTEGWSNISLTDINSHSAIVGTADYNQAGTPEKRVILLLPVEIDTGDPEQSRNENPWGLPMGMGDFSDQYRSIARY
ncbi:MAG: hypothetical protein AAGH72_02235, partial [Verrucomicrobiota bacterium]